MIKCEFCGEEFEYQDEYEAHLKIKHPEESQGKEVERMAAPIIHSIQEMFSQIENSAAAQRNVALGLTNVALAHSKTPEEVFNFYNDILAWIEGRKGEVAPVPSPLSKKGMIFLVDREDVRDFVNSKGITDDEIEIYKTVSKAVSDCVAKD